MAHGLYLELNESNAEGMDVVTSIPRSLVGDVSVVGGRDENHALTFMVTDAKLLSDSACRCSRRFHAAAAAQLSNHMGPASSCSSPVVTSA